MSLEIETPLILDKHLLGIEDTTREQIELILELTDRFAEIGKRPIPKVPALRGRTVASVRKPNSYWKATFSYKKKGPPMGN